MSKTVPAFLAGVPYAGFDSTANSDAVVVDCSDVPSRTLQSEADACDINLIMAKYHRTGVIDFARNIEDRRYVNLADQPTFAQAMDIVASAKQSFEALPSSIRSEFANDVGRFLAFVSDPKNQDRAYDLGVAVRPAELPADPVNIFKDAVASFSAAVASKQPSSSPTKSD